MSFLSLRQGGAGGGDVSAKTASAATAYSMIEQAVNLKAIDGGCKIAEVQGVFPEFAKLIDPALDLNGETASAAFDNAADALALASSAAFRDLVNTSSFLDGLGRASTELSSYYGTYLYEDIEFVDTTNSDPTLGGTFGIDFVFNGSRTAIYYAASNTEIGRRPLSEAGNVLSAGAEETFSITTLYGGGSILSIDLAPDESRMIICDNTLDAITEVIFTTPGDVSTATEGMRVNVSNVPRALCYSPGGTAVWMYDTQNLRFRRWALSTPYDWSTLGSSEAVLTASAHNSGNAYHSIRKMRVNSDETEYYVSFSGDRNIYIHRRSGGLPQNMPLTVSDVLTLPGAQSSVTGFWLDQDDFRDLWATDGGNIFRYRTPPAQLKAPG